MLVILKTHRDVLEQYQQRFKYIMVDEYQDTNAVQYLWLRLLAHDHKKIQFRFGSDQADLRPERGDPASGDRRYQRFPTPRKQRQTGRAQCRERMRQNDER